VAKASDQATPAASGIRWAQDEALGALGNPSTFWWAQALVLDIGGDDDQWMAMLRRGTGKGARVGAIAVGDGAVAYGELIGPAQGRFGSPKRDQPRWTLLARASDVAGVEYRPYVRSRFSPYSDVTIHTPSGRSRRFGIDWSRNVNGLVCALRELAGAHPDLSRPTGSSLRSDGAYVSARSLSDKWQLLVYSAERAQVAVVSTDNPGRTRQRIVDEPDDLPWLNWQDLTQRPDGAFDYGEGPVTIVPGQDRIVTTSPDWRVYPSLSSVEYQEWSFFPAEALEEVRTHRSASFSPTPGRPVLEAGDLHVAGYEPFRTAEQLEVANTARGPIDPLVYLESAVNDSLRRGKGFFESLFFEPLISGCVVPNLRSGDRIDLAVPIVVEVGPSADAVGPDAGGKVRPTGKCIPGMIVTLDDRVLLAWTEGIIRMTPRSQVISLADITAVHPFTLTAKMSTIPAAEILTSRDRHVFTFTNHPDCRADLEWWRRILIRRLTGHHPVFDGPSVIRWETMTDTSQ